MKKKESMKHRETRRLYKKKKYGFKGLDFDNWLTENGLDYLKPTKNQAGKIQKYILMPKN
jgi:hypothetical protein